MKFYKIFYRNPSQARKLKINFTYRRANQTKSVILLVNCFFSNRSRGIFWYFLFIQELHLVVYQRAFVAEEG